MKQTETESVIRFKEENLGDVEMGEEEHGVTPLPSCCNVNANRSPASRLIYRLVTELLF